MNDRVVDWKGLKLDIPYSRTHIWRMMAAGDFPQFFKLGKHRNSHPVVFTSDGLASTTLVSLRRA
jgi:Prophage CP4-57 regulatory protein (AlpA)